MLNESEELLIVCSDRVLAVLAMPVQCPGCGNKHYVVVNVLGRTTCLACLTKK
jgi:ribosomal protein S27E